MAVAVTHTFVTAIADDGTPTGGVQPSHWNAAHTLSGLGTGVATALAINVGSAGAFVAFNGALGTPSSGMLTACTGLPAAGVVGAAAILGANAFTATQTITEAVGSSALVLTGATQTSSFPVINATQTWNASGTTFTGLKLNITSTASAAASLLLDLQVGGSSKFYVDKAGLLSLAAGAINAYAINFGGSGAGLGGMYGVSAGIGVGNGNSEYWRTYQSGFYLGNGTAGIFFGIASQDLGIGRNAAGIAEINNGTLGTLAGLATRYILGSSAVLQQGAANAASPVAQTLQAQGSRAGTDTNIGGAIYNIGAGVGTGTGTLSVLNLQSPIAVASGTGAQTQTTGLAIKAGAAVLTSYIVANLPAAATAGAGATAFVTDASTTLILGLGGTVAGGGANKVPVYSDGTNWLYG